MVNEVQATDHKTIKIGYYVWQNLCVGTVGVCNESIECNSVGVCDKANAWGNGNIGFKWENIGYHMTKQQNYNTKWWQWSYICCDSDDGNKLMQHWCDK
jgi:hypothetical protein